MAFGFKGGDALLGWGSLKVGTLSMASDEVVGMIKGLAAVVKDQQAASKDAYSKTQQQIQDLSAAVLTLSDTVGTKGASSSPLRLPQLTLPEFTGRENLDRFAEQLTNVLSSSGVAGKFWFTYLKQQCRNDARAFDIICNYETTHASTLSGNSSNDEYITFYDNCLTLLVRQRGIPKEQQIRQILSTYYAMSQQSTESVADFAHRFLETQHSLEKLIPGVHRADGDIELIHAFMLKLQPVLSKDLVSRDSTFSSLTAVIEAAKRLESVKPVPSHEHEKPWKPQAFFAAQATQGSMSKRFHPKRQEQKVKTNFSTAKDDLSGTRLCRFYNKFDVAHCELPNNECSRGYIHKCSICFKVSCKAYFHPKASSPQFSPKGFRHPSRNSPQSHRVQANYVAPKGQEIQDSLLDSVKAVLQDSFHSLKQDLTTSVEKEVKRQLPQPSPASLSNVATTQDPLFSMPATTSLPVNASFSAFDLAGKNILWAKVTSAGVSLPLPLDSCCSVSLVSQNHAETVVKFNPALQFTKLEQPIPVSVAGPNSSLRAVGLLQVPIVWETGKSAIFTMLVVPNLTWPILFGQNHLRQTDARIYSKDLRVFFADPAMNFEVKCYDTNPNEAFPTLRGHQPCRSSTAYVTCLLTPLPPPGTSSEHVSLTKGLNLVTVCIVVAASLVSSPLLAGPLWLEGTQFSPNLQSLSGLIDLQSLKRVSSPGEISPSFFPSSHSGFSKCRPSRPLIPSGNSHMTAIASQSNIPNHFPDPQDMVLVTNILVYSDTGSATLPFHVSLGKIRPFSDADTAAYRDAVSYTAQYLSDNWFSQVCMNEHDSPLTSEHLVAMPSHTSSLTSGLDSSLLSEFLENNMESGN